MANYNSSTSDEKGSPNLEALQYLQDNWGEDEINASLQVEKVAIIASATGGQTTLNIPVGAEIVDIVAWSSVTSGSGTVTASVGDGGAAISDAIAFETEDTKDSAATIDRTYKYVTATGITLTTNGNGDLGDVYIYYKK